MSHNLAKWSPDNGYFSYSLAKVDGDVFAAIEAEHHRQEEEIELIASENIASKAVMEAQGSVLTNKYAEGYPGKRYYGGCAHVDIVEQLAMDRAKQLFGCEFANVQPPSGSQANQAVFFANLNPGDCFMGLDLSCGGHLTHGMKINMSGKWFNVAAYKVDPKTHLIDMNEVRDVARSSKPKLIIAGGSAYARHWDFAAFREIADEVGAILLVDMAHFAGLVAGGAHPSPFPHAHVVTTTTHKTLRGARGGMILTNDETLSKKINSAVFPGVQGGPLMHIIAGKAVGFKEALDPSFKDYAQQVVDNAKAMAASLMARGYDLVTHGTDNHIVLMDLRSRGLTGKAAEEALGRVNITCNKNGVPFDEAKPTVTSGIRLGSAAATTRGFGTVEFTRVGELIANTLDGLTQNPEGGSLIEKEVLEEVLSINKRFPLYR